MAPKPTVHDEEDDLDDLDDIVDQFDSSNDPPAPSTSKSLDTSAAQPTSNPASSSNLPASLLDEPLEDEFSKALSSDMEALLRELSLSSPGMTSANQQERAAAWEKMLVDGLNSVDVGDDDELGAASSSSNAQAKMGPVPPPSAASPASEDAFQRSIRQAMEKLKQSDSTLQSDASTAAASGNDPLEALLGQIGASVGDLDDTDGALQGMLEEMMGQLMSKEVLYEPLKELHDKFPGYIKENESKLSPDEKKRYDSQAACVSKVIAIFEDPNFKDGNPEKGAEIATLMNEMQSYGSPPTEIMGPLPPGLDLGPDGTPNLPEGCTIA